MEFEKLGRIANSPEGEEVCIELTYAACEILERLAKSTGECRGRIASNIIENFGLKAEAQSKERTWNTWVLHESTIKEISGRKGLSLEGKDMDEIARLVRKGIDAALDFVWEEAIENAIKLTPAEGIEEAQEEQ